MISQFIRLLRYRFRKLGNIKKYLLTTFHDDCFWVRKAHVLNSPFINLLLDKQCSFIFRPHSIAFYFQPKIKFFSYVYRNIRTKMAISAKTLINFYFLFWFSTQKQHFKIDSIDKNEAICSPLCDWTLPYIYRL